MPDILIRGLHKQIVDYLNSAKGGQSRDAFLRGLLTDHAQRKMLREGILVPNLADMQAHDPSALDCLQRLYIAKMLSYPRTASRHLPEQEWKHAPAIVRRLLDMEDALSQLSDDGYHRSVYGSSLSKEQATLMADSLSEMVKRGYPAPSSLYNDDLCDGHGGIFPLLLPDTLPSCAKASMGRLCDYVLYRKVVAAYLRAHWTLVAEHRSSVRREQSPHPWTPFRDRETGAIVTARWEPDSEAEGGGAWEVAGQVQRVSATDARNHWITL